MGPDLLTPVLLVIALILIGAAALQYYYSKVLFNLRVKEREVARLLEEAEEQKEAKKREALVEAREEIQRLRAEAT